MTWIETFSGKRFDLLNPKPEQVDLHDIAHALARINRFTGHTNGKGYSVAEHSLHVCQTVMEKYPGEMLDTSDGRVNSLAALHAHALFHDAAEAYVGDVSYPMKLAMRSFVGGPGIIRAFDILEERAEEAIWAALGLPFPTDLEAKRIKEADLEMLRIERHMFMPHTGKNDWGSNGGVPDGWSAHRIGQGYWRDVTLRDMQDRFMLAANALLAALHGRSKME